MGERFRRTVPSCRPSWPISPGSLAGVPSGATLPWRGLQRIDSRRPLDPGNGKQVFANKCVFCHGSDGLGTMAAPPCLGTAVLQHCRRHGTGERRSFLHQIEHAA